MIEQPYKDYTLCYLPRGAVSHAMWDGSGRSPGQNPWAGALCGVGPAWFDSRGWFGTGSQEELEVAVARPLCKRCKQFMREEALNGNVG